MERRLARATLFPYTTLFRSVVGTRAFGLGRGAFAARGDTLAPDARVWAECVATPLAGYDGPLPDRKSTRLNSSHANISYAVFCLKKKNGNLCSLLLVRRQCI